mmetsp:Transcript_94178/g.266504  ORF Transcript_94178/g.266504 Transcript_94178/m.266504 type:complete len:213 (-) Transcript_94178:484-1122(-)
MKATVQVKESVELFDCVVPLTLWHVFFQLLHGRADHSHSQLLCEALDGCPLLVCQMAHSLTVLFQLPLANRLGVLVEAPQGRDRDERPVPAEPLERLLLEHRLGLVDLCLPGLAVLLHDGPECVDVVRDDVGDALHACLDVARDGHVDQDERRRAPREAGVAGHTLTRHDGLRRGGGEERHIMRRNHVVHIRKGVQGDVQIGAKFLLQGRRA